MAPKKTETTQDEVIQETKEINPLYFEGIGVVITVNGYPLLLPKAKLKDGQIVSSFA